MVAGASSGRVPLPLWMRLVMQLSENGSAPGEWWEKAPGGGWERHRDSQPRTVTELMVTGATGAVALPDPVMPCAAMPVMTSRPPVMLPNTV